jgi:hypothetical protein
MPGRSPKFYVPRDSAPAIMEEIHLQAEAKRRKTARSYNPDLGATAEEAQEKLEAMRRDINAYGEYSGIRPSMT